MKTSLPLSSVLLMTTMLFSPYLAAQETTEPDTPPVAPTAAPSSPDDTIVVRGAFIPEPQRTTAQVASFLSSEDLERQGDFDAAQSLTRLSGLSIVGGRFPFVRGLGDRYSVAILNGSPLPSTDPLRRAIPLDLFPSNALDGIDVQKTFSADYPAEFGGGVINLRTLKRPDEPFLLLKYGMSGNTVTTLSDGLFVRGGDLDWSGWDDGTRDVPAPIQAVLDSGTRLRDLSDSELEAAGESLTNSPLNVIQRGELGPNFEGTIEAGTTFDAGGFDIGVIGIAGYRQEWTTEEGIVQRQSAGIVGVDQTQVETSLDVLVNALGNVSVGWGDNEVKTTIFYVHSTLKEAQITQGSDFNAPGTGIVFDESSGWYERELAFGQLSGQHGFDASDGEFLISWRGSVSQSTRDAPYERRLGRFLDDNGVPLYSTPNNNDIRFSDLTDESISGGGDIAYTFTFAGGREGTISAGGAASSLEREYNLLTLRFAGGNSLPLDVQSARADFLFSPDNIDPARFELIELPSPTDSYDANLDIYAGYVQADVELFPYIRTTVGVRYEDAEQSVNTFNRFGVAGPSSVLENEYWLPSAALTWNFAEDMQLRFVYSQTITRPQFRELASSLYFDPESERNYRGNPFLVDSELKNYDLRYEFYLGTNQFFTLAGFYKDIDNPIEESQFETSSFNFDTTFINSPKAELFGGEFEYRINFDTPEFLSGPWMDKRSWLFSVNYTYTNAEIKAEEGDTIIDPFSGQPRDAVLSGLDGAKLVGTPEHIFNTQVGWQSDNDQFTVLLGWVDERILQRGVNFQAAGGLPDVVEDPGVQLDVVYRYFFEIGNKEFTLGLSGRNLLDTDHVEYQDGIDINGDPLRTDFNTYERGRSFSASLSVRF